MTQWVEFDSAEDVAEAAADAIQEQAHNAIQQRGEFKLILAGGTTPKACYEILATRSLDWDNWKLFYGDERCLPLEDSERNHQMVMSTGLAGLVKEHYIMPAELGSAKGAESYQKLINDQLPFNTALLGMGEDGHTASLFPGLEWQCDESSDSVIAVHGAPKPPSERISLSCATLQNCEQLLVLVTGESKRTPVHQWLKGVDLPVSRVANLERARVFVEASLVREK